MDNGFANAPPTTAATPSSMLRTLTLNSPPPVEKTSQTSQSSFAPKSLFSEPDDLLGRARIALHTHSKTSLPGREKELTTLNDFIESHLESKTSGSLYISGPPGTGKTACLSKVLERPDLKRHFKVVNINCTSIESPKAVYSRIATQLNIKVPTKSGKAYQEAIEKYLLSGHKMM